MSDSPIDQDYIKGILNELLTMASPSGMTDRVVNRVCGELDSMGITYELTRRGAIRADLPGRRKSPDRAIVGHLDTLGAMVKWIRPNGRLRIAPIGHWSSRFAEGARCTVHCDGGVSIRGTILPLKASGHVYNKEVDSQPNRWDQVELRLDAKTSSAEETAALGVNIGDTISVDSRPEFTESGHIVARHLDDKAGVAAMLAAAKVIAEGKEELPMDCHLLFTITEEVGAGASHVLHGDVAELVSVDNGTFAPEQNTSEYGVTISMMDMTGPFDWHLTRHLIDLCRDNGIEHSRDVFNYYRSDAAAALEAGNDIRTALVCFGLDASHGHERVHMDSLMALSTLLLNYMRSPALFDRDKDALGPLSDFPEMNNPSTD
ncbi:osmoprotectant NAGGN system M42 family peptidase [Aestuariispira ectoiniformans]|uniref:osmoprotectant NAGGN system M42 family peptidase n=1 Tax=Aestuariispira ectoiniformans TaxID=2775080 RepID=UPI00223AA41E|nr:osmoprotectant NAGGN system M42 family peptidase [Aestuariispira ectoiniformans]